MMYSDSSPLYLAYLYILLKWKQNMPTYNFLLLELSYEYQNWEIIVVLCVNLCFLMLSFWGFLFLLFLIYSLIFPLKT